MNGALDYVGTLDGFDAKTGHYLWRVEPWPIARRIRGEPS
jgi:hypothetical protein